MFENFSTSNKNEHPTEEEIRADFESKEKGGIEKGINFFEKLDPEKLKETVARVFAASLMVFSLSAVAEQDTNKDNLPGMGEEQIQNAVEKNHAEDSSWEKISKKIVVSVEGKSSMAKDGNFEAVGPWIYENSDFNKGMTREQVYGAVGSVYSTLENSQNSAEFFNNLAILGKGLSDQQKGVMLQQFGQYLGETYNYDMLDYSNHVAISGDKMFRSLKDQALRGEAEKSGICGNIHTFMAKIAQSMGIGGEEERPWLQSGNTSGGNHVWMGMVLGNGAEKQIVFSNYGDLIFTGTLDYQKAIGLMERDLKRATIFNSFVANTGEVLFPVESLAGEVLQSAGGVENSSHNLKENLKSGETRKMESGVEININPEMKKIKLTKDSIALLFTSYKNVSDNPYQSLDEETSLGVSKTFGNKNFSFKTGATVIHMSVDGLTGAPVISNEIMGVIAADYADKKEFDKKSWGQFLTTFGASFAGAIAAPLSKTEEQKASYIEGKADVSAGFNVAYLNPNENKKVWFGLKDERRLQINDMENQDPRVKEVARNISIGAEVKVYEGSVVKMEVGKGIHDWGESTSVEAGVEHGKIGGTIGYTEEKSDYERFKPSTGKIEVGASYKWSPQVEVKVIGSKTTKEYKDAGDSNSTEGEVKLIMQW